MGGGDEWWTEVSVELGVSFVRPVIVDLNGTKLELGPEAYLPTPTYLLCTGVLTVLVAHRP